MKVHSIAFAAGLAVASASAMAATGPRGVSPDSMSRGLNGAPPLADPAYVVTASPSVLSFTQSLADPFESRPAADTARQPGGDASSFTGSRTPPVAVEGDTAGVTAVSTPQTYTLLLAGLAGVAFMSRRLSN